MSYSSENYAELNEFLTQADEENDPFIVSLLHSVRARLIVVKRQPLEYRHYDTSHDAPRFEADEELVVAGITDRVTSGADRRMPTVLIRVDWGILGIPTTADLVGQDFVDKAARHVGYLPGVVVPPIEQFTAGTNYNIHPLGATAVFAQAS